MVAWRRTKYKGASGCSVKGNVREIRGGMWLNIEAHLAQCERRMP
jgi:hypothetical protein